MESGADGGGDGEPGGWFASAAASAIMIKFGPNVNG